MQVIVVFIRVSFLASATLHELLLMNIQKRFVSIALASFFHFMICRHSEDCNCKQLLRHIKTHFSRSSKNGISNSLVTFSEEASNWSHVNRTIDDEMLWWRKTQNIFFIHIQIIDTHGSNNIFSKLEQTTFKTHFSSLDFQTLLMFLEWSLKLKTSLVWNEVVNVYKISRKKKHFF